MKPDEPAQHNRRGDEADRWSAAGARGPRADAIGPKRPRCTRSCAITWRRCKGRSAMVRSRCASPSTPVRSWKPTWIAGCSAAALRAFCARTAGRGGWWRSVAREGEADGEGDPEGNLAASAVSGQAPPAGPQWVSRLAPFEPHALAARARLRQAAVRVARWVHVARGDASGRSRPGGAGGAAALRAATTCRAGARGAACGRSGAHHAEEGLHRRDDRGRHGPAVSAVPAGHQRAATAVPHREVRGSAGPGEPVEGKSRVLRLQVLGEEDEGGGGRGGADEVA